MAVCIYKDALGNLCSAESFINENNESITNITILEYTNETIGEIPIEASKYFVTSDTFYVKAPQELLYITIPLSMFSNNTGSYFTIPEYLNSLGKPEVTNFSKDGYFLKGFNFNLDGLDELRNNLSVFNLELNTNFWIMSQVEAKEELLKDNWI